MAATGMIIDGILGSEAIDSSGEILEVEGADISDWEAGTMMLNWEHRGEDAPGASALDIVGRVIFAKKIYSREDCDDDRQREYWDKVKLPFIYGICRLFDGAGHPAALALAAIVRDHHANGELITVRFSVEGSTLLKDGQRLKRSVVRRVALTIKPCNRSANSGLLEDPKAPPGYELDEPAKKVRDLLADLADGTTKKSEVLPHPNYTPLGGAYEAAYNPVLEKGEDDRLLKRLVALHVVKKALEKGLVGDEDLAKAYTAGLGGGAPSTLTGGAALQREDISERAGRIKQARNLCMAALRDYGKSVTDKAEFRAFCKHRMPEADESFIDHFVDRVHDFTVRKAEHERAAVATLMKLERLTIDLQKAARELRGPQSYRFGDHEVHPGRAHHAGGEYLLLHEDGDGYLGVPAEAGADYGIDDLVRLPRLKEATHYRVASRPHVLVNGVPHAYAG